MRNVKWLAAAGLLISATGCVETNGYPATSYGGYPSGYGQPVANGGGGFLGNLFNQPTYYQQPAPVYYQQQPAYYQQPQTRYVPVPVATQPQYVAQPRYTPVQSSGSRQSRGNRDSDGDGIPNKYDRDKNNDGIPDRQQRRAWGPPG